METVGQLRKAVVFHLYYHGLWEKIKPYLLNLQEVGAFDLYITPPVENKELFDSIKQSFSCAVNIYIYIVKHYYRSRPAKKIPTPPLRSVDVPKTAS